MRTSKTITATPKKRTYTRKAVKKAIESQDEEIISVAQDLQEAIRIKAYELFLSRGQWGNPEQDWIEAEKIVLSKTK